MFPYDPSILAAVQTTPQTISDVVQILEGIQAICADGDGLKWFNGLYLDVTKAVEARVNTGGFADPAWIAALDVRFARFYFAAIQSSLSGGAQGQTPGCWQALFNQRNQAVIARIQFAFAGMNAHINHDLALALLNTDAELNVVPAPDSPEFADYQSVNGLLNTVMPSALSMLAADTLGVLAEDTGKIGRLLAFWDIRSARNLAWDFANHLRGLSGVTREVALSSQDALTGALGRAILAF